MSSQKLYHMTDHLKDIIYSNGLKPIVGKNSKLVNDVNQENIGISYSIGLEGIIATNAMFHARYQYNMLENQSDRDVTLDDMFAQDINEQEQEALGENIYLTFNETEKIKEENKTRDIADPKTKSLININDIKGITLTNLKNGERIYDRNSIIMYAISHTEINNIVQAIEESCKNATRDSNTPFMNIEGCAKTSFSFKDYIKRYYTEMKKSSEMVSFQNGKYVIEEINVNELLKIIELDNNKKRINHFSGLKTLKKQKDIAAMDKDEEEIER